MDERIATQLRTSFNARDLDGVRSLIAPDATWGDDSVGESFCRSRDDIIRRLKQLLADGVQATIVETTVGVHGIAAQVEVRWPEHSDTPPDLIRYAQVYVVRDGLVTEIRGHPDMGSAVAAISA